MSLFRFFLILFYALSCVLVIPKVVIALQATQKFVKSSFPFVRNFKADRDYKGNPFVYAITEDENGNILFSNEGYGIQQLTGNDSRIIQIPDNKLTGYFYSNTKGRIYVSGFQFIGYLQKDETNRYVYSPIKNSGEETAENNIFFHHISRGVNNQLLFLSVGKIVLYNEISDSIFNIKPVGQFYDACFYNNKNWIIDTGVGIIQINATGEKKK